MLKLLRNFALAGLLLAGIMKLFAWWAGGHNVERLVAALAPAAQVKYESVSAGLDGSISLDKVSVDVGHRVYRADSVVLESPGLFWLLAHAVLGNDTPPEQFGIEAQGLKLPPLPWLDPQWLDPATFVPFVAVGCGSGFSEADYQRLGIAAAPAHERLEYRYDAAQHAVSLHLNLKAPGFAQLNVEADLKQFDPQALRSPAMWDKVHVDQLAAEYSDLDFLSKRNASCAQRVGSANPAQFIERHIDAVQELLKAHRIDPSNELVQLYRTLLEHGGQASVLSLPSSSFVMAAFRNAPDDLLRQLNVTARYKDKPPIMFRLAFAPAPEEPTPTETPAAVAVAASPVAAPSSAATPPAPTAVVAAPPKPAPSPAATPVASTPVPQPSPPPVANPATPATSAPEPAKPIAATPPAAEPATKPAAPAAAPAKPPDDLGLHNLDREIAKLAPPPKREVKSALLPIPPGSGSTEAPPPGSLLSMVWKPSVFEALPEAEPEHKNYDIIDYANVNSLVGRYVQVITEGGKKIGGYVLGVDDTGLKLQVNREGGNITFVVAKTRVQQIRLLHY